MTIHTLFPRSLPEESPICNAYGFKPVEPIEREPAPAFEVDRKRGCVFWTVGGFEFRLIHADQFRALGDIFQANNMTRNFNALCDAELALSEPLGTA